MKRQLLCLTLLISINSVKAPVVDGISDTSSDDQNMQKNKREKIREEKLNRKQQRLDAKNAAQKSIKDHALDEPIQYGFQPEGVRITPFIQALRDVQKTDDYTELNDMWNNKVANDPAKIKKLATHIHQDILNNRQTRLYVYPGEPIETAHSLLYRDLDLIDPELADAVANEEELSKAKRKI